MACVSLPPKLSERVVRRVVIVFDDTELIIRVNTEFRVERFPRFLYRSRFTEHSPLLSHRSNLANVDAVRGVTLSMMVA